MPDGLSPSEAGKELAEHRHKAEEHEKDRIAGVILVFSVVSLVRAPKPPV